MNFKHKKAILLQGLLSFFLSSTSYAERQMIKTGELESLKTEVEALFQKNWDQHIKPQIPDEKSSPQKTPTSWSPRLTPPLPLEWPRTSQKIVFYSSMRGIDFANIADGENTGPVWAKITVGLIPGQKSHTLRFELITTQFKKLGTQGVRPLSKSEIQILQSNPLQLLFSTPSQQDDRALKDYYCLQKAVGNLPQELLKLHPQFFKWLGC